MNSARLEEIRDFLGDPQDTIHIGFPSEFARELLAALDASRAQLAEIEADVEVCGKHAGDVLIGDRCGICDAKAQLAAAENALSRIRENATSWHGNESVGTGADRALAVIAGWVDEVLAAAGEPGNT